MCGSGYALPARVIENRGLRPNLGGVAPTAHQRGRSPVKLISRLGNFRLKHQIGGVVLSSFFVLGLEFLFYFGYYAPQ